MTHRWKAVTGSVLLIALASAAYYARFVREIAVKTVEPQNNTEVRVFGIGTVEGQIVSKVGFQVAGS